MREASGDLAIGEAAQTIRRGQADRILTGATGTRIHPYKTLHALGQVEVASDRHPPEEASRPFDADRTGMVLGEGAGVVILEELAVALARGATIYGEVCGRGSGFAMGPLAAGKADLALVSAMRAALANAGITPDEIGHVHAYGDSTTIGDAEEARAIGLVFGDRAREVPVVSAKSAFGNLGAGSSVVELIASLLAFRAGRLFATQNYRATDPACPLTVVFDNDAVPGDSVLNLSVTPQGQSAALVVRAWNG
jgi:3-oxoacyl-[acyl-carrier-protein] synthase II